MVDFQWKLRALSIYYSGAGARFVRCHECDSPAVIDRPYANDHLCVSHFRASIEERFRREMHRQLPRFPGGVIAVALSGGKDSSVALALSQQYFGRRPHVRLVALTVDEGIDVYRATTIASAADLCHRLDVDHRVLRARDLLGTTTDEASRALPGIAPCSYCGVWRRQLLNRGARDVHADALVLGFNLDDLAQTVLMNLARADVERMPRMAPHRTRQPGLIPRIAPLASIPEREVYLYARLNALPFDHAECPHAHEASRNVFRDVVWRLEAALPGTRHALLRTHERIVDLLAPSVMATHPGRCADCGEPAGGQLCRACEYLRTVRQPKAVATTS